MRDVIYLDYAATTPVDPRVAECMQHYLTREGVFGNPASSNHGFGRAARDAVEQARAQVSDVINAAPHEIIWTSGATESINLALKGVVHGRDHAHLITCATEHRAVLDVCAALEQNGIAVTRLGVDSAGMLDLAELQRALRADTALISIMHVNNETGAIQDIESIGEVAREHGMLFHVDAAQSAGKLPLDVVACKVDLVSLTAHKVYGPKGIGALYVRSSPPISIHPLIDGGGHERGRRAGTLATHQIAAMGEAFRLAAEEIAADRQHCQALRNRLWNGLQTIGGVAVNGNLDNGSGAILNVCFEGVDSEELLLALPGIAMSSGAACSSAIQEPSHVLRAMGSNDEQISGAIRFSWGRFTTADEIDHAVHAVRREVAKLRTGAKVCGDSV